jgi:hypothetical protein
MVEELILSPGVGCMLYSNSINAGRDLRTVLGLAQISYPYSKQLELIRGVDSTF